MGPKVERLKKFMQDCWDGRKVAAGVWECTYRDKPPELDGEVSMLDEALAEEFERGRDAGAMEIIRLRNAYGEQDES